MEIAMNSVGI